MPNVIMMKCRQCGVEKPKYKMTRSAKYHERNEYTDLCRECKYPDGIPAKYRGAADKKQRKPELLERMFREELLSQSVEFARLLRKPLMVELADVDT